MDPHDLSDIELHAAGAIVRHTTPFELLKTYRNPFELTQAFISEWVIPLYMSRFESISEAHKDAFVATYHKTDAEIVRKLLGDFNWRPRIVGAYFAALHDLIDFEDIIGTHLLKSEVCFAGRGYCLALASFSTTGSKEILKEYLRYYLTKPELYFDQGVAMSALYYIDETEGQEMMSLWDGFVLNRPNWDLDKFRLDFSSSMDTIKRIQHRVGKG